MHGKKIKKKIKFSRLSYWYFTLTYKEMDDV